MRARLCWTGRGVRKQHLNHKSHFNRFTTLRERERKNERREREKKRFMQSGYTHALQKEIILQTFFILSLGLPFTGDLLCSVYIYFRLHFSIVRLFPCFYSACISRATR